MRELTKEVWVAGLPGRYGGSEAELDHLVDLFRAYGVTTHLVAVPAGSGAAVHRAMARGCVVHDYHDRIFADRIVLSFCNQSFLAKLPLIVARGRPRRVVFFNCMTTPFPLELVAHEAGWIDYFGFVSDYQRSLIAPILETIRPVQTFPYRPYFNLRRVRFRPRSADGTYRIGRISRDDGAKFAPDTWPMFDQVRVPPRVRKQVYVLGFGANARRRIGPPPPTLDAVLWPPDSIPARWFFASVDTLLHRTGGSRESYCRVLVEAYAHGVVAVVERDFAFPELVVDGVTGFLAEDSSAMSEYATALAHDRRLWRNIAINAREHLETVLVDPEECWRGWQDVLALS